MIEEDENTREDGPRDMKSVHKMAEGIHARKKSLSNRDVSISLK
jgi:hypothetical protein